jgi:hypothetical protein
VGPARRPLESREESRAETNPAAADAGRGGEGHRAGAPFQKALGKLTAKGEVTVVYEVSAFWGKRFGAWHGKVECKAEAGK